MGKVVDVRVVERCIGLRGLRLIKGRRFSTRGLLDKECPARRIRESWAGFKRNGVAGAGRKEEK